MAEKKYLNDTFPHFLHGSDYNPEQWKDRPDILDEDMRLMKLAKMNEMTIGVFSWAELEPEEGVYDFSFMDKAFDMIEANGGKIILATPSGARPRWLAEKYPEVLRTNERREKMLFGKRHNHCYSSPVYREKVRNINRKLAERYGKRPSLYAWHISNEVNGECHCELCRAAFIEWCRKKYNNDIELLNHEWWTTFWSHKYADFEQIEPPSSIGETCVHGLTVDWKRFCTDQTFDFMLNEQIPIR
ncbi:MAG: beta-galactosidase, partial [Clostridia bacterium]|nr:beta-galactosidase [Clostridia bacterium]